MLIDFVHTRVHAVHAVIYDSARFCSTANTVALLFLSRKGHQIISNEALRGLKILEEVARSKSRKHFESLFKEPVTLVR